MVHLYSRTTTLHFIKKIRKRMKSKLLFFFFLIVLRFTSLFTSTRPNKARIQIRIRDFNLVWKLYDGYDWEQTRSTVQETLAKAKEKAIQSAVATEQQEMNYNEPLDPSLYMVIIS